MTRQQFLPLARMEERAERAREESDTAYFFDLLYQGEMLLKLLVAELVAGLDDDREHHRYGAEHRLVRADGLGEWADVLDEVLTGPTSQHLCDASRDSHRALSESAGPGAQQMWQRHAVDRLVEACRCLDENQPDLSGRKVSMRNWARNFVWLRNRTRGHGSPKAATLATVCPALRDSLEAVVTNAPAFARDWAFLKRGLSGKFRVSLIGGDREPFTYLTRESNHPHRAGVYVWMDGPRRVDLFYSDPDLSDFGLPNGNYRKTRFELLSYVTDETRSEDGTPWSLPAEAQPASETTASPAIDLVGNVFTNLPPRREGYIDRPDLERELCRVLKDERNPVVTLQGRGGVGKTSVALEVLHQLTDTDDFFGIIWFSARDIDLLPEGPKVVRADVLSTDDVARDFTSLMSSESRHKSSEARRYLTDCLSGQADVGPFIFVFDNFETIREQADLYSYVNNAVRLPNKVLITTRTRDFKADYPIEVSGMTTSEYKTLVDEVANRLGIRTLVTDDYEADLYDESDGHPYITKVLLGEVAREGRQVSLKRVVASKETLLDALFDRSFAQLSPGAQRVFLTLCAWRSLVPRIGLEAVLLRPGNERMDVAAAIRELENTSLVEDLREMDSSFLSVPLAAALFGKKKLMTSPMKIAIDADLQLVHSFGPMTSTEVSLGLQPRLDRLTKALAERLSEGSDPESELAVVEYIAREYPPAWLNLAALQQELGNTLDAIASVGRYLESRPKDEQAWRQLANLYRRTGDGLGEMHARVQLASLARPEFHELSTAAARLNTMLSNKTIELHADERRLMARKLRELIEARIHEADATDISRLAWLCMHDQDRGAAGTWAREGLRLDPENEHCQRIVQRLAGESPGT